MTGTLRVRHAQDYRGEPLLVVENMRGPGAELTPAAARALAVALLRAADDCETPVMQDVARRFGPQLKEYSL